MVLKRLILPLLCFVVLGTGIDLRRTRMASTSRTAFAAGNEDAAVPVIVAQVSRRDVPVYLTG